MIPYQSNLPVDATPWGRERSDSIASSLEGSERTLNTVLNRGRSLSGQLAVLSERVRDLGTRATLQATAADVSVTGNNSSYPTASRNLVFPAPEISGIAQVEIYAQWNRTGAFGAVTTFANVNYGGVAVGRLDGSPYGSSISGWGNNFRFRVLLQVPVQAGEAPTFVIRWGRAGFTSTTTTETLSNIHGYLTVQPAL